jgi:glyoxylase-like metal-dependent hydrolase (beta-lactamase superfamily II)
MPASDFSGTRLGDYTMTALSDGSLSAGLDLLTGITLAQAIHLQQQAGFDAQAPVSIHCYLLRGHGHTVLVDAGAGGLKGWGGELPHRLRELAIAPGQIDTILLTHAHPDHVGGLLDAEGARHFPNAELLLHRREWAFWQDDEQMHRASPRARGNFLIARQVFDGYRATLRTFESGEVLPGIQAWPLAGHTVGHTGYLLASGGERVLIGGDIVHYPHIQIARPDVSILFDQDPAQAAATRAQALAQACAEKWLIAGMHLGGTGFARIEREADGFRLAYVEGTASSGAPAMA